MDFKFNINDPDPSVMVRNLLKLRSNLIQEIFNVRAAPLGEPLTSAVNRLADEICSAIFEAGNRQNKAEIELEAFKLRWPELNKAVAGEVS